MMDHENIARVALLLGNSMAKAVADLVPHLMERNKLDGRELATAIAHALTANAAGVVAHAAGLPDSKAIELNGAISKLISAWIREQAELEGR